MINHETNDISASSPSTSMTTGEALKISSNGSRLLPELAASETRFAKITWRMVGGPSKSLLLSMQADGCQCYDDARATACAFHAERESVMSHRAPLRWRLRARAWRSRQRAT